MSIPAAEVVFEEIIRFLASSPSQAELVTYQPPVTLQARMSELLEKNRQEGLNKSEQHELDEFLRMNRFMSRLRLHAKQNPSGL